LADLCSPPARPDHRVPGRRVVWVWQESLEEANGLGLLCNIYDENSYPSGFAGGHVPSLAPATAAQYVQAHLTEAPQVGRGPATLSVFKIERDEKNRVIRAVRVPPREVLPSLFWDVGDWRQVRFDQWQTLHDLGKESYLRPIFEWCDRNSLQFTGHFMEREWPYPRISPDDATWN
jgi:hypothetical protein